MYLSSILLPWSFTFLSGVLIGLMLRIFFPPQWITRLRMNMKKISAYANDFSLFNDTREDVQLFRHDEDEEAPRKKVPMSVIKEEVSQKTPDTVVPVEPDAIVSVKEHLPKNSDEVLAFLCKTLNETSSDKDTKKTIVGVVNDTFAKIEFGKWASQVTDYGDNPSNEDDALFAVMGYTPGKSPVHFKLVKDKATKKWVMKEKNYSTR